MAKILLRDILGQVIKAGDEILYTVREHDIAKLMRGTVSGIFYDADLDVAQVLARKPSGRPVRLSFPERIVVVTPIVKQR